MVVFKIKFLSSLVLCQLIFIAGVTGQGAFNVYYGNLHAHTGLSDGTGTPDQAFDQAKNDEGLDFFAITDHDYWPDDMTGDDWAEIKQAADEHNEDGVFTAFRGFEWTSDVEENNNGDLGLGHFTIINTETWAHSRAPETSTLSTLSIWLTESEGVAFFNHPGQYSTSFDEFDFLHSDNIVGMELWNRSSGFSYYYNDGYNRNDGNLGYYDEALSMGWFIGAGGGHDNHDRSWGNMNDYRLAVLAPENTREAMMTAFRERRFFSTADKNLVLSFTAGGSEMGSKIAGGSLEFIIAASDADDEVFDRIQLLKNGDVEETWRPDSANALVAVTVETAKDDYYYVRVRQDDEDEAISSPIFITEDAISVVKEKSLASVLWTRGQLIIKTTGEHRATVYSLDGSRQNFFEGRGNAQYPLQVKEHAIYLVKIVTTQGSETLIIRSIK